eukprot:sb/3479319/
MQEYALSLIIPYIITGRCSTYLHDFKVAEAYVVVKPLECKRGIASKLNGQLEFTIELQKSCLVRPSFPTPREFEQDNEKIEEERVSVSSESAGKGPGPDLIEKRRELGKGICPVNRGSGKSEPGKEGTLRGKLKREKSISKQDVYNSSTSSRDSLNKNGKIPSIDTGSHEKGLLARAQSSSTNSEHPLNHSLDLRRNQGELCPDSKPYRKLSLTPNLPRLEKRTALNNCPLQMKHNKFSTSEDSDFIDSDLHLSYIDPQPTRIEIPVPPPPAPDSLGASCTSLTKEKDQTSSSGGSCHSVPMAEKQQQERRMSVSYSAPSLRKLASGDESTESVSETDKVSELQSTVLDKRKHFASGLARRKQNLLTPNLTDIGERSDNSDQSFDHGDVSVLGSGTPGGGVVQPTTEEEKSNAVTAPEVGI